MTRLVEEGVSPGTIHARFVFLQTVLAARKGVSAMRDGLLERNPCHGVMLPTIPTREVTIYQPEETDRIVEALDPYWRPLAMFAAETGLRWGELMGLRVSDFELDYRAVTARRTVVEISKAATGTSSPFTWKPYPKGKVPRRIALTPACRELVRDVIAVRQLGAEDRLFSMPAQLPSRRRVQVVLDEATLAAAGDFEGPNGRRYAHGTLSGYQTGKCRCQLCKQASADYRWSRLPNRSTTIVPVVRRAEEWPDGLPISRSFFRESVWLPVHADAGVKPRRFHDLRASHISWLLAMGLDLPTIMERVGHREFETTRRYTTTMEGADDKILDAMSRLRAR